MRATSGTRFQGFVIRRRNYREADRILTVFSREKGKIDVLAKGVRRLNSKRAGQLEVFSQIRGLIIEGRSLYTLAEIEGLSRLPFSSDLETVSYAYYLCEIIDKLLPQDEPYGEIYRSFAGALGAISGLNVSLQATLVEQFAVETLTGLGYLPEPGLKPNPEIVELIERISERRVLTPRFIRKIQNLS